ncbi:hypothetical protein DOM22_16995 [Bdellovibrio sp. ZAP7]|uniref:hypothetical protein n=1 Tax=Bdellovibrio sp. ZAP7 TaxID=2231053 RepID=UPI00115823D1|nr:hypothetical protein [Bdellovibrio sp. ZAP7]QDK46730.1 hypothetical protein DOM22_16995 [Bdellovibrio sp. ZAP7]
MRKILASILVVLTVLGVAAYAEVTSIKQDMMMIEKYAKQIKATAGDASQNSQNAVNANQIALLLQANLQKVPDIIRQWPQDQQPAVWQNYTEHINYAMNIAVQMQTAFQSNDNATGAALIQQLFAAKDGAHQIYNH